MLNNLAVCALTTLVLQIVAAPPAAADSQAVPTPDPPPSALLADLPFEDTDEYNRVVVDLAPEGSRPFPLMLDTGASGSVLTPGAARELGVSVRRTKSSSYRRKTLLGRDLQFSVDTASSDTGSKTGWEYGLLGANFLHHYVVEFDFGGRSVRFYDPENYHVPEKVDAPNEWVFPIRLQDNRPTLEVQLADGTITSMIDTGAPSSLIVGGKAAKRAGIDVKALPKYNTFGTVLGNVPARMALAVHWAIGPFEFVDAPVVVLTRGWHNQTTRDQSVLGYDSLQQFKIRIDYERRRMWMKRERPKLTHRGLPYAPMRKAGTLVWPINALYYWVGWVAPDSPADKIGLRRDDYLERQRRGKSIPFRTILGRIAEHKSARILRHEGPNDREGTQWILKGDGSRVPTAKVDAASLARETARRDAEELERFEREKNSRIYVEVKGGWMRVEGARLRAGPREGERFVTYEELQRIKAEREENASPARAAGSGSD